MNIDVIYEQFSKKVKESPEALAVFDEKQSITRAELDLIINTIANQIPDSAKRIGIIMDHSVYMIAAIFAVLKNGMAYVPVEPSFPQERINFMMRDAEVDFILTNKKYKNKTNNFEAIFVDENMKTENISFYSKAKPNDLAYILYTSGSTGNPKGVAVRNRNVCHYVRAFQNEFHINESDVMLQYSVCSFDIFVEELFSTLLSGAVLAIPSEETKNDISSLMKFVEKNNVTIISGFPYLLLELNELSEIPKSLRLLISGGDVLRASYVTKLIDKVKVYNTYGPSETTVCASYYCCNNTKPLSDGTYPIGKPILGTQIQILNKDMKPVKQGEIGEICILGGGVSAGYIGSGQIENEAFKLLSDETIIYQSGDYGYFLPDGNIAFLHRKDSQVMILGRRVELEEVENTLYKCSEIEKAVVKSYLDERNLPYMVAYIVLKNSKANLTTLKKKIAQFLPDYMIPEFFICMDDIPINENGKVDSTALPVIIKEDTKQLFKNSK